MIEVDLRVEDYCNDCLEFDPDVRRIKTIDGDVCTVITCEYKEKCARIKSYLEQTKKE